MKTTIRILFVCSMLGSLSSCVKKLGNDNMPDTTTSVTTNSSSTTQVMQRPASDVYNYPVTLPVIDAFFADSSFTQQVRTNVGLSDSEVVKVQQLARQETAREQENGNDTVTTTSARQIAMQKLSTAIGQDKSAKLISYVQQRWSDQAGSDSTSNRGAMNSNGRYNVVPQDSRIVVNAPEFRMDVFDSGKLVKSYKVAIGYPEFPLPTSLRHASKIIFNPSWTTPDEPWVETSKKVSVGQKVLPGDKLNPLGIMKIPIGLPSLIHGGKNAAQLGNFGSHGCVGLTNDEAKDFVKYMAVLGGDSLNDNDIAANTKTKDQSKDLAFKHSVPVELRYETIVLEDGKLHIFRDVYDHNTNTDSTLNAVLQTYGSSMASLSPAEQQQIRQAMVSMGRDANGNKSDGAGTATMTGPSSADSTHKSRTTTSAKSKTDTTQTVHLTKTVKGQKEIVIPIAELAGKGYPAMAVATPSKTTKGKK